MRCYICDYCPEVEEKPVVPMIWDEEEKGYVCADCEEAIADDLAEDPLDLEDLIFLELGEVENDQTYLKEPERYSSSETTDFSTFSRDTPSSD